ncbi:MAG TPA: 23S rRNA (pseudouridine(1915)-N(3))-methyltransferase RlmH [Burkholderiaceae bacterium]|nr:23S rRNA (pseudouridine(1915)-N(3))-methyltransferase RlmH [Burkholderiaceae bacterium]
MLIRVIAIGTRMPAWVGTAVDDYSKRLPAELALEWREIKAEPRTRGGKAAAWMQKEAARIEQALPPACRIVALDERGADLSTARLAACLRGWQERAQPVAILIGGPDGLDPALKSRADESIRLSSLTLPHPLVRVLLAEQLYRAWSVLAGHPYHRD